MKDIELELKEIIQKYSKVNVDNVGKDEDLVSYLSLDSLSGLKLLATIEKKYSFKFPDERLTEFRTINKIMNEINLHRCRKEKCKRQ